MASLTKTLWWKCRLCAWEAPIVWWQPRWWATHLYRRHLLDEHPEDDGECDNRQVYPRWWRRVHGLA